MSEKDQFISANLNAASDRFIRRLERRTEKMPLNDQPITLPEALGLSGRFTKTADRQDGFVDRIETVFFTDLLNQQQNPDRQFIVCGSASLRRSKQVTCE